MNAAPRPAMGRDGWVRAALQQPPALDEADERVVAGRIGGGLFVLGGVLAAVLATLSDNPLELAGIAVVLLGCGGLMLTVVPWRRTPPWAFFATTVFGVLILGVATAFTDGVDSPPLLMGAVIITWAGSFLAPRRALVILALVTAATLVPLAYDGNASGEAAAELVLTAAVQILLGAFVIIGAGRVRELAADQRRLAREQTALLDLAKKVASDGDTDDHVFTETARDAAEMLEADGAALLRFQGDEAVIVADHTISLPALPIGTRLPILPGGAIDGLRASGDPTLYRFGDSPEIESAMGEDIEFAECAIAPIRSGDHLWGIITVACGPGKRLDRDAPERLAAFADLISTAIVNRETRRQLVDQATRDPLTGLFNHRAFHERLRTELARAQRYGRELALVVLDVDHFKAINDAAGHDVGDEVLQGVAARLREGARTEDTIARIGGDEFAMLLPETDGVRAYAAIERTRALIGAEPILPGIAVTTSAGICDLRNAQDADTMFRLADGALYWSKAHGRNATWIYDPEVVRELSAAERAEQLQRSQALLGIRALARAIDAKDPSTRRHSERVAALSRRIAEVLAWDPARIALLEEAALVHDVGKIGVPDAVLLKPGRLTPAERQLVGKHADLGARIVEDVLTEEQVDWIRAHHERPDGQGYPRGLVGATISMGAAILAVADSFDVMTMSRPYSAAKDPSDALSECQGLIGWQFASDPVEALVHLHGTGELIALIRDGESDVLGEDAAGLPPQS